MDIEVTLDKPVAYPDPNHPPPRPQYPKPNKPRPGRPWYHGPSYRSNDTPEDAHDKPVTHPDPNHPPPRPKYPEPNRPRPGLSRQRDLPKNIDDGTTEDASDKPATHSDPNLPLPRSQYPETNSPRTGLPEQSEVGDAVHIHAAKVGLGFPKGDEQSKTRQGISNRLRDYVALSRKLNKSRRRMISTLRRWKRRCARSWSGCESMRNSIGSMQEKDGRMKLGGVSRSNRRSPMFVSCRMFELQEVSGVPR